MPTYEFAADVVGSINAAFFVGLLTFTLAFVSYNNGKRARKAELATSIWRMWSSKDYRHYRVIAHNAIKKAKLISASSGVMPKMSDLLEDESIEEAIGSVEHFFFEVAELKKTGSMDTKIFHATMMVNIIAWKDLLSGIERMDDTYSESEIANMFSALEDANGNQNKLW
jgi:hypothetical protein